MSEKAYRLGQLSGEDKAIKELFPKIKIDLSGSISLYAETTVCRRHNKYLNPLKI
jgi:hypothetical protein